MATKIISGVYNAGYSLSAAYSVLSITSTGFIGGAGLSLATFATVINYGAIEAGGAVGATGAAFAAAGLMNNGASGLVFGGQGKSAAVGSGHAGYSGGIGLSFSGIGTVTNYGGVNGGLGGGGGTTASSPGATGGQGGVGVMLTAGGVINNGGLIYGGIGGVGGMGATGFAGGDGGLGGVGVFAGAGVTLNNSYAIDGGAGGAGGVGATNGAAGQQGVGVVLVGGGALNNGDATDQTALVAGSVGVSVTGAVATTVKNFGVIAGYAGTAVSFASASDLLIAYAGSSFVGALTGGGGTLALMAGGMAGVVDGMNGFGAVSFATGASWEFEGANIIQGGLNVSGGTVTVTGTIDDGKTGTAAIKFVTGVDRLVMTAGGVLVGAAVGDGAPSTLELSGGSGTITGLGGKGGVLSGGDKGAFHGFGTYVNDIGGVWVLKGSGTLTSSQAVVNNGTLSLIGTLSNSGAINGGAGANGAGTAGHAYGGAGGTGLSLATSGSLANAGSISGGIGGMGAGVGGYGYSGGGGGAGVVFTTDGVASNSGQITGGQGGAGYPGVGYMLGARGGGGGTGASLSAGTLVNSGMIAGGAGAVGGVGSYVGGDGGSGGGAVTLTAGSITNNATLLGGRGGDGGGNAKFDGLGGYGGAGAYVSGGALTNTATITGGQGGNGGGGGTNGDPGAYGGGGVILAGTGGFINKGVVTGGAGGNGGAASKSTGAAGAGGAGVRFIGAGTLVNSDAITGGVGGGSGGSGRGAMGDGVDLGGAGVLINGSAGSSKAVIVGQIGVNAYVAVNARIDNFATIQGSTYSVVLGSASDTLVVETGARFIGAIKGGGGALEIGGGAISLSGIGTATGTISGGAAGSFSGFATYRVDASASVTLVNTGTLSRYQSMTDNGSITLAGTLVASAAIVGGQNAAGVGLNAISVATGGDLYLGLAGTIAGGAGANGAKARFVGGVGSTGGSGAILAGILANQSLVFGGLGGAGGMGNTGGRGGVGGVGAIGLAGGSLANNGVITGGAGGAGGVGRNLGGAGAAGGAALYFTVATSTGLYGSGSSIGGVGGGGGYGALNGGAGGTGGTGLILAGAGMLTIKGGSITGGQGGVGGGASTRGGDGGAGGVGVSVVAGGAFSNLGVVAGGLGAAGGLGSTNGQPGIEGVGVSLTAGGAFTNGSLNTPTALLVGSIGVAVSGSSAASVTNFGTIRGSTYSVLLGSAADSLIVESGATFVGAIIGGGGLFDLDSGAGVITGLGAAGTLSGSEVGSFSGFGSYVFGNGTVFSLTGTNALGAGKSLVDGGALTVSGAFHEAAGASISLATGTTGITLMGTESLAGAISGAGSVSLTAGALIFNAGATLGVAAINQSGASSSVTFNISETFSGVWLQTGGGVSVAAGQTLTLSGKTDSFAGALLGLGAISLTAGATTLAAGATASIGAFTVTNKGTSVTLKSSLTYAGSFGVTAGASFSVASGAELSLTGPVALSGTLTGAGAVSIDASSVSLGDGTVLSTVGVTVDAVTVAAAGGLSNSTTLSLTVQTMTIDAAGFTLSGGGQLSLSDFATNLIAGVNSSATFSNIDNVISGAGALGDGTMTLINRASGTINGNGTHALTIDTGANSITNAGLIEASGSGGVVIRSAVVNSGTLEALGGVMTVNGSVTSNGQAIINGGVLDFTQSFNEAVTFYGSSGVLELGQSQTYKGSVTGLSHTGTNSLDLSDIAFVSVGEAAYADNGQKSGGVLTVSDGVHTAKITLVGNYAGATFKCSSDGHGGVVVIDPTKPVTGATLLAGSPAQFAQAMASTGLVVAAGSAIALPAAAYSVPMLSTPPHT